MKKTVTIDETTYTIAPLTFGQGKELFSSEAKAAEINTPLLKYSLSNADSEYSDQQIDALPYPHAMALLSHCLEINGLHRTRQGEGEPAKAEPTGPTSAEVSAPA